MAVAGDSLLVAEALLRLSDLLRYPSEALVARPGDGREVQAFFEEVARVSPEGMEELYTRTFDLNPVATLEVGWHLWGEQYERGRFLADLRDLQDGLGIDGGSELPDHLTVLLATLACMEDRTALAAKIAPALQKIAAPLEEQGNPYRHLIAAAAALTTDNGQPATAAGGRS
jgi:nitrate reductase delta subunit